MSGIIPNLQGYTAVRNAIVNDYAIRECVDSMLAFCENVLVCDSDSTDGTREMLDRWADKEPRLTVINYPWPNPKGDAKWFTKWLNFARERLTLPMQLELDADEVLDDRPVCHARIREAVERQQSLTVTRLNYWKGPQYLIPEGHCCGKRVVRVGKSCDWMPSDEGGYRHGELPILDNAVDATNEVFIHHVGFLRRTEAFYKKARVVLAGFFNEFDKRLIPLEKDQRPLHEVQECEWTNSLVGYSGHIPDAVQRWLAERGHDVPDYLPALPPERNTRIEIAVERDDSAPLRVLHSGDFGDLIHGCAVMQAIGNVDLYLVDRGITKPIIRRMPVIVPLLESMPYINSVRAYNGEPIDWNASDFRTMYSRTQTLGLSHLLHYQGQRQLPAITVDFKKPWLSAKKDNRSLNRIVINRTARYNAPHFPWKRVVAHYGNALMFVGTQDEHTSFERDFGKVQFTPTSTLLEVAGLIAGSELFIGNQSAALAIAEALKHQRIQETCLFSPDCIYGGYNAQYCVDGTLTLPAVGGHGKLEISSMSIDPSQINTMYIPKGGWQFQDDTIGSVMTSHVDSCAREVKKRYKGSITIEEAKRMVVSQNIRRQPRHFARDVKTDHYRKAASAITGAGITDHPLLSLMRGNITFNV